MTPLNLLPLHAGAVVTADRAILIPASTGTGKTTLTTYLSANGCAYISDDTVHIDMTSLCVHCSPEPLHLREESIPILRKYGVNITEPVTECENYRRIVYLPKNLASGDIPIGGIFLIKRSEHENSCQPVPSDAAVQLIMQNLMTPDVDIPTCLRCAVKLAPLCRRVIYADMKYVRELIENSSYN